MPLLLFFSQAKFPLGFRTLFNSSATRASAAVTRCTADSVNIPADFVNPYADLSIEDFGLTGTYYYHYDKRSSDKSTSTITSCV